MVKGEYRVTEAERMKNRAEERREGDYPSFDHQRPPMRAEHTHIQLSTHTQRVSWAIG